MKRLIFVLSVSAVILTAGIAAAQAGVPLDHLVCYKTMDPLKLPQPNTTDLLAQLQPEFSQKGCTLLKAIEFCVPATKLNVQPPPPDPNIVGQPLKNDYICYLAKCPNPVPPPDKQVIDQFGSRLEKNYRVAKVCVPAQKRPPGCGQVGSQCLGACPAGQVCQQFKSGGIVTCDCAPKTTPCGGKPDAAGLCTGTCTDPTQQCVLAKITTTTGQVQVVCTCQPPPQSCGRDPATGACGGTCTNATDQCITDPATGQCTCEPAPTPCQSSVGADGAVTCGGVCPLPGQNCAVDTATGKCSCQPPAGCSQDPLTGACGGTCLNVGDVCALDSTGHCGCQPPPCGSTGNPAPNQCGGACPFPGQQCTPDATGACNCQPLTPCGPTGTNTCGGTCPVPGVCRIVPGTTNCACQ